MDVIQMSKYLHRGEHLDFTTGLLPTEEECSIIDVPASTLANLLRSENTKALAILITRITRVMYDSHPYNFECLRLRYRTRCREHHDGLP